MATMVFLLRFLAAFALFLAAPALAQGHLPQANTGKTLDTRETLVRIAVGSCNRQDMSQRIWPVIAAQSPQLFVAMGDNVYGDNAWAGDPQLESFRAAYARQAADPQFRQFRNVVPMLATWDDHDYGTNDSGGAFPHKARSEALFEAFWRSDEAVRGRPGVYQAHMIGPESRRVQLILLDTRYFRSEPGEPGQQMLGKAQWQWLGEELARPAQIRVIVSSIQVLSMAHPWEKWDDFAQERERLFTELKGRAGGALVLLSGDRHAGAIYSARPDALGETVWEMTASSLNKPLLIPNLSVGEKDGMRETALFGQENFGLLDIDWTRRALTLRLVDASGHSIAGRELAF